MKKVVSILLVLILFSCQELKKTGKTILHIELSNFKGGHISLVEIGNEIEYYPLENQFPIGIIYSYLVTNEFIYAAIKDVGVVRFTKEGKLNIRYGKIGRGPGEYVFCLRFAVDENTQSVYVMDHKMNDIEVYNNIGDHIRNVKLPVDDDGFGLSDVEYFGSSLFLAQSINMGRGDHDWLVMDTLGNKITEKNNPYPEFKGRIGGISTLSKINNNLLYWDNFKDTVFHVYPDFTYSPVFVLSKGKHKFPMTTEGYNPMDVFFKNISGYMLLQTLLETRQFFILEYKLNEIMNLAFINKKSGEATMINLTDTENGIDNDLDNGLPFLPEKYFEIGDENYLASFIQPFKLKKHVASDEFKNSTSKFPEKKKALEELANSLNANDNPVLMLVKLKE